MEAFFSKRLKNTKWWGRRGSGERRDAEKRLAAAERRGDKRGIILLLFVTMGRVTDPVAAAVGHVCRKTMIYYALLYMYVCMYIRWTRGTDTRLFRNIISSVPGPLPRAAREAKRCPRGVRAQARLLLLYEIERKEIYKNDFSSAAAASESKRLSKLVRKFLRARGGERTGGRALARVRTEESRVTFT